MWINICESTFGELQDLHWLMREFSRMAYIEENLKIRNSPRDGSGETNKGPADPQEELYRITDRWKANKREGDDGNVTNSLTMLTAIPEVDLGMEYVMYLLKSIYLLTLPQHTAEEYRRH
jgi:hypothetical protein